eukprot:TRINITY_DN6704_c0_g1_i1.p1 TRINITY_DN6704_c0_g1~~TRINITY_DN6704_c0_g1_i1.p1  ORF type:complete len:708 (+),score=114.56 TRINITY_DN6704_c0_g1_i1:126-2249(+)
MKPPHSTLQPVNRRSTLPVPGRANAPYQIPVPGGYAASGPPLAPRAGLSTAAASAPSSAVPHDRHPPGACPPPPPPPRVPPPVVAPASGQPQPIPADASSPSSRPPPIAAAGMFEDTDPQLLQLLSKGSRQRSAAPGEQLLTTGDRDDSLWILEAGEVEVLKHALPGQKPFSRMLRGPSFFGEATALGLQEVCGASVKAVSTCDLRVVPGQVLQGLLRCFPRDQQSFLLEARARMAAVAIWEGVARKRGAEALDALQADGGGSTTSWSQESSFQVTPRTGVAGSSLQRRFSGSSRLGSRQPSSEGSVLGDASASHRRQPSGDVRPGQPRTLHKECQKASIGPGIPFEVLRERLKLQGRSTLPAALARQMADEQRAATAAAAASTAAARPPVDANPAVVAAHCGGATSSSARGVAAHGKPRVMGRAPASARTFQPLQRPRGSAARASAGALHAPRGARDDGAMAQSSPTQSSSSSDPYVQEYAHGVELDKPRTVLEESPSRHSPQTGASASRLQGLTEGQVRQGRGSQSARLLGQQAALAKQQSRSRHSPGRASAADISRSASPPSRSSTSSAREFCGGSSGSSSRGLMPVRTASSTAVSASSSELLAAPSSGGGSDQERRRHGARRHRDDPEGWQLSLCQDVAICYPKALPSKDVLQRKVPRPVSPEPASSRASPAPLVSSNASSRCDLSGEAQRGSRRTSKGASGV